ncbi:MAG: protein kinase [Eubacteriales bacterium]|nr:protein kinase [Eubacteriales bacterium]
MTAFFEKDSWALPSELAETYQVDSCLKYSEQAATYLLSEKSTGRLFLLKTSSDPVFSELLANEKRILEFIHMTSEAPLTDTFPWPVYLDTHQDTAYYIRTYIKGKTLEELCETNYKKPGLPVSQALGYIISLTELLSFLHGLNPPLIHRDIKPQNVVVDGEGICHFIDFGISRFYQTEKRSDTMVMGTRLTAPPEQFGYHQTDIRSDLYSLGILLLYCITGEYEVTDTVLSDLSPELQAIIRKATMFDPAERYQTAGELLPDLLAVRYPGAVHPPARSRSASPSRRRKLFLLFAVLAFLFAVFFFTDGLRRFPWDSSETVLSDSAEYRFAEPMIEEAVRTRLNLWDTPVTYGDLKKITSLNICGLQIYNDDSEIWFKGDYPWFYDDETRNAGFYLQDGPITSLEDLLAMPNLTSLSLYRQQISDLSLLKDTSITHLGLGYNPLTDLSPLLGNASIRSLNLASLEISDTEVLATLPNLENLNISATGITSLNGLETCRIKELNLIQQDLSDYSELQNLPYLENLILDSLTPAILSDLQGLPITELSVHHSHNLPLDSLSCFPNLETLFFSADQETVFQAGSPDLPNLKSLDLVYLVIEDFSGLASLDALETLQIYGSECESYEGLDKIPGLRYLFCTEEQKAAILDRYPENSFLFP